MRANLLSVRELVSVFAYLRLAVVTALSSRVPVITLAVPRLQPVAGSRLSQQVHAQLGASWVEDASTSACMACATPFSNMVRRHHCRVMGIVVCDSCSLRRAVLPGQGSSGARVCDAAFNMVRHLGRLAEKYDADATTAAKARAAREQHQAKEAAKEEAARVEAARAELLGAAREVRHCCT